MEEGLLLSVIIPNYNGAHLLSQFLPSVDAALRSVQERWEVIVVDDCSHDGSCAFLESHFPSIVRIKHSKNLGFSHACNSGIVRARGRILCFLNNDVCLDPNFFLGFKNHFEDKKVFAVTPLGFDYDTREKLDGCKIGFWKRGNIRVTENKFSDRVQDSFSIQGAYFFADAKKVKQLEGFDCLFSPYIFEETDLAYRALKRGWRIIYDPRLKAYHKKSSTLSVVSKKFKLKWISERNRTIFTIKNIHSGSHLFSHLGFFFVKLILLKPATIRAFISLAGMLGEVLRKRAFEKKHVLVSDKKLLTQFETSN